MLARSVHRPLRFAFATLLSLYLAATTLAGNAETGDIKANLGLADGSFGASLVHAGVGCASFTAQGAKCWQGAIIAGGNELLAPTLYRGYQYDSSKSSAENLQQYRAYQRKASSISGTFIAAAVSGGDINLPGLGHGLGGSAAENNAGMGHNGGPPLDDDGDADDDGIPDEFDPHPYDDFSPLSATQCSELAGVAFISCSGFHGAAAGAVITNHTVYPGGVGK